MDQPLKVQWDGEAFVPDGQYWARRADEQFVVGEHYLITEYHDRSINSHRHYFASLNEIWQNLPEHLAAQFPSAEHLRKHALIREGYADKRSIVCHSAAEAKRMAAFIRPLDTYAIVTVDAATVTAWTAQSQSMRAMGGKRFQESKQKVLDWCAALIGVEPQDVEKAA